MAHEQQYYPGSRKPIAPPTPRSVDKVPGAWDDKPRHYKVNGVEHEFFTTGMLAQALGRKPVTIRQWERLGVIPKATYKSPSKDPRGHRRLYSRPQVEGIMAIAKEEGLLNNDQRPIRNTEFTEKVIALFRRLRTQ